MQVHAPTLSTMTSFHRPGRSRSSRSYRATANCKLRSSEPRRHGTIGHSIVWSTLVHLVWDSLKPSRICTAWNFVYQPRYSQNIPYRVQKSLRNSNAVTIISTNNSTNSITADNTVFIANSQSPYVASSDRFNWCRTTHHFTLPAYMQAAVFVSGQGAGLMTIMTHRNVVVQRSSMTT